MMNADEDPPGNTPGAAILGLPEEILKEICGHCSQFELICLSLVCRRFRELAAAHLYRNFHIVFPDEDDPSFDSPIDGLAGGLETFVTSDYDYAKHLRDLSLDTLSAGHKAETAYRHYLYSVSCGKFLNTLLLLTLRKARFLDKFRWNIRVELSRPVYKTLHNIQTLKHLHIRLQSGPSLYEPPPPLPLWIPSASGPASHGAGDISISPPPIVSAAPIPIASTVPGVPLLLTPPHIITAPATAPLPTLPKQSHPKPRSKKTSDIKDPATISGFKDLESLAVLDIDNLEVITEIKTCVRNSSSTLRKLELSFSDSLAMQARKPSVDVDTDDSDQDDEFQLVPLPAPTNTYNEMSGPAKAFRAQEERKAQESILGRIFEIEPFVVKKHQISGDGEGAGLPKDETSKAESSKQAADPGKSFIESIRQVSQRLSANIHGSNDVGLPDQQEMLDMIVKAAQKYVDSDEVKAGGIFSPQDDGANASASQETKPTQSETEMPDNGGTAAEESKIPAMGNTNGKSRLTEDRDVLKPEDIDVAAPEEQLGVESLEEAANDEIPSRAKTPSTPQNVSVFFSGAGTNNQTIQTRNMHHLEKRLAQLGEQANEIMKGIRNISDTEPDADARIQAARKCLAAISMDVDTIRDEMSVVKAEMQDLEQSGVGTSVDDKEQRRRSMNEYTRGTRGIPLESLSIHLIPIKASVLTRAIDVRTLKKITLLNVGAQAAFWVHLAKENKLAPLPLRQVFTDNVSLPFLNFANELERLDELYMLQRSNKYRPESFAPNTRTTITQIRKLLKKHLPTLRCLMIKNEADSSWDLDGKTTQLICQRGKALEELAVSMGISPVHTFLQYMSSLTKLFALHIISFRHDDTCLSVMRETRRFIVDTLSHHPNMKLEWVSMGDDDRVQRITRRIEDPRKSKAKSANVKGKGVVTSMFGASDGPLPVLPTIGWSDSESEDESDSSGSQWLKFGLVENIAFYDVWGVEIFSKEILAGRL